MAHAAEASLRYTGPAELDLIKDKIKAGPSNCVISRSDRQSNLRARRVANRALSKAHSGNLHRIYIPICSRQRRWLGHRDVSGEDEGGGEFSPLDYVSPERFFVAPSAAKTLTRGREGGTRDAMKQGSYVANTNTLSKNDKGNPRGVMRRGHSPIPLNLPRRHPCGRFRLNWLYNYSSDLARDPPMRMLACPKAFPLGLVHSFLAERRRTEVLQPPVGASPPIGLFSVSPFC